MKHSNRDIFRIDGLIVIQYRFVVVIGELIPLLNPFWRSFYLIGGSVGGKICFWGETKINLFLMYYYNNYHRYNNEKNHNESFNWPVKLIKVVNLTSAVKLIELINFDWNSQVAWLDQVNQFDQILE